MGRLGYLLSHYPSANHTYLLREVRALRAAGIEVVVVAVEGDARPGTALTPAELEERGTTFVVKRGAVPAIAWAHLATFAVRPAQYMSGLAAALRLAGADLKRLAYHVAYFAEAVVAGRYLHRAGCEHVHTHYASTVAVIAAHVFRFQLSATIHGSAEFIEPGAQRLREKILACTFVRAISMYGRSQLMLASAPTEWSKFSVVRLGVDPDVFVPGACSPRTGSFRVATVGQLQPAKGFHVLLDALALLCRRGHDVSLTIVGDGVDRVALEAHVARLDLGSRVTFTGMLNQPSVRDVLANADAFVLPSFAEGIPVVLMEAMASGLPCVATRITGIPELIQDGVTGLLVTPSDTSDLASALERLSRDEALRARVARAGRRRVVEEYSLDRNIGELVNLFRAKIPALAPPVRTELASS